MRVDVSVNVSVSPVCMSMGGCVCDESVRRVVCEV